MSKQYPPYVDADAARKRVIKAISVFLEKTKTQSDNKMHMIKLIALRAADMHNEHNFDINKLSEWSANIWFNRIGEAKLNKISRKFNNNTFDKEVDDMIKDIKQRFNLK